METSEAAAAHPQKDSVKVAVNIRPLITVELQDSSTDCVTVTPGEPQVQIGPMSSPLITSMAARALHHH